jgi:hypothetical protein
MLRHRKFSRSSVRTTIRRSVRCTVRVRWRAPDDLGESLAAFRQAIRCHRRLARLAPGYFDSVVVAHTALRDADNRRRHAVIEPALAKIYGCDPEPYQPEPAPSLPPPKARLAIEQELNALDVWLLAGQTALELYHRRRPHDRMTWTRLDRLLQIGHDFGQLACGLDPNRPPPEPTMMPGAWPTSSTRGPDLERFQL